MQTPIAPPAIALLSQFCNESNISTDEEFFRLFGSINWHDVDCENGEQLVEKFKLAKVNQDRKDARK